MGRKLDIFLGRVSKNKENEKKLKSLIGLAVSRLAVLKSHREVRYTNARDDVAQLLRLGHHDRALLRVEQVIKEQNMVDVYAMTESYGNLVSERYSILENTKYELINLGKYTWPSELQKDALMRWQKECPEELKEAISGLIFAASRCGDLPELQDARQIFVLKFGKDFVGAASEMRNGCAVDLKIIRKMSTRQPTLETRQKILQEIATEKGIKLESNLEISTEKTTVSSFEEINVSAEEVHKYKDVIEATQAAFNYAATAAVAAKAAMVLSRSDFRAN